MIVRTVDQFDAWMKRRATVAPGMSTPRAPIGGHRFMSNQLQHHFEGPDKPQDAPAGARPPSSNSSCAAGHPLRTSSSSGDHLRHNIIRMALRTLCTATATGRAYRVWTSTTALNARRKPRSRSGQALVRTAEERSTKSHCHDLLAAVVEVTTLHQCHAVGHQWPCSRGTRTAPLLSVPR